MHVIIFIPEPIRANTADSKEKKRRARAALLDFRNKLEKACDTYQSVNDWFDHVSDLNSLIKDHYQILGKYAAGIEQIIGLVDKINPSMTLVRQTCVMLRGELKEIADEILGEIEGEVPKNGNDKISSMKNLATIAGGGTAGTIIVILVLLLLPHSQFDFAINSEHVSSVIRGQSIPLSVTVTKTTDAETENIFLGCSISPQSNIKCKLDKESANPDPIDATTLRIITFKDTPPGVYTASIQGVADTNSKSDNFQFEVKKQIIDVPPHTNQKLQITELSTDDNSDVDPNGVQFRVQVTNNDKPISGANVRFVFDEQRVVPKKTDSSGIAIYSDVFSSGQHKWFVQITKQGYIEETSDTRFFYVQSPIEMQISVNAERGPDMNNWYRYPVKIYFTSNNPNAKCDAPIYSGPDGFNISVPGSCTSELGESKTTSLSLNYDATSPETILNVSDLDLGKTIPDYGRIENGHHVRFYPDATDVSQVEYFYSLDGSPYTPFIDSFNYGPAGEHILYLYAVDDAGNNDHSPVIFHYSVFDIVQ